MRALIVTWLGCMASAVLYLHSSWGEPAVVERRARIADLGGEAAGLRLVVSPGGEPRLPADLIPRSPVYALMQPGAQLVKKVHVAVPVPPGPADLYAAGDASAWSRVPSTNVSGELQADLERFSYVVAAAQRPTVWHEVSAPSGGLYSFAFAGARIFAAGADGVFTSQNGGESWQTWGEGLPPGVTAVDALGNSIFATGPKGTYVRQIGEPQWRLWPTGVFDHNAHTANVAVAGHRLYTAVDDAGDLAVRYSDDAGRSWHDFSGGLPMAGNARQVVLATDGAVLLASVSGRTFKAKAQ